MFEFQIKKWPLSSLNFKGNFKLAFLIKLTQFEKTELLVDMFLFHCVFYKLYSKMPVFKVHFGQHFLRNSVKILHRPRANDQSYSL